VKSVKTVWFIVNPISGTQDKKNIVSKIPVYFPEDRFKVEIKYTRYSGHAAEIAGMAVEAK
jgi:diacylglycerol kinase family enzyme